MFAGCRCSTAANSMLSWCDTHKYWPKLLKFEYCVNTEFVTHKLTFYFSCGGTHWPWRNGDNWRGRRRRGNLLLHAVCRGGSNYQSILTMAFSLNFPIICWLVSGCFFLYSEFRLYDEQFFSSNFRRNWATRGQSMNCGLTRETAIFRRRPRHKSMADG